MHALIAAAVLGLLAAHAGPTDEAQMQMMRNRLIAFYTGQQNAPGLPMGPAGVEGLDERTRSMLAPREGRRGRGRPGGSARTVLALAQAWSTPGSAFYNSPEIKGRIESELAETEKIIRPGSPHPGNWYNWLIALPRNLGPALILCEGRIDPDLFDACVAGMGDCLPRMSLNGANAAMEGRNNVYLALLQHDPELLGRAVSYVADQMVIGGGAAGIMEDYSYQFHGRLLHTMGYGADSAYSIAQVAYLADGTRWSVSKQKKRLFARHLLAHVPWPIVGDTYDLSVRGRQVASSFSIREHIDTMLLLASVHPEDATELTEAAQALIRSADPDQPAVQPPYGFRHFYTGDFSVFRRPEFYTSVRMYSDRVIDYEGNPSMAGGTNLSGWFLCYGLTYVSRTGQEYKAVRATRSDDFDWDRLPGTTTRVGIHPPKAYNPGTGTFAGGAGGDRPDSGGVCGFVLVPAAGDYVARKSYHFFDRGFVALGSGITSHADHPEHVVTTVAQWAAPQAGLPLLLSGEREIGDVEGDAAWRDVRWAWHDGVGYAFFEPVTLYGHRRGALMTLWLDHGPAPEDATYAYAVLPSATPAETSAFAERPTVRIARQEAVAHACRDTEAGATGIVFWKAGEAAGIASDAAAVCYVEPRYSGEVVTVQNPLHTEARVTLRLHGRRPGPEAGTPATAAVTGDDDAQMEVETAYGRVYRVGLGVSDVRQQPRGDFYPYASLQCEAESDGPVVTLTVHLPKAALDADYRLLVRGKQGHLRAELTEEDVIDRPGPDVVRFRWRRTENSLPETVSSVVLLTDLYQSYARFPLPALDSTE